MKKLLVLAVALIAAIAAVANWGQLVRAAKLVYLPKQRDYVEAYPEILDSLLGGEGNWWIESESKHILTLEGDKEKVYTHWSIGYKDRTGENSVLQLQNYHASDGSYGPHEILAQQIGAYQAFEVRRVLGEEQSYGFASLEVENIYLTPNGRMKNFCIKDYGIHYLDTTDFTDLALNYLARPEVYIALTDAQGEEPLSAQELEGVRERLEEFLQEREAELGFPLNLYWHREYGASGDRQRQEILLAHGVDITPEREGLWRYRNIAMALKEYYSLPWDNYPE